MSALHAIRLIVHFPKVADYVQSNLFLRRVHQYSLLFAHRKPQLSQMKAQIQFMQTAVFILHSACLDCCKTTWAFNLFLIVYQAAHHNRDMLSLLQALCPKPPFLPRAGDPHPHLADTSPEAALLDSQFRLLREDMVGPLKEELQKLGIVQQQQQQHQEQEGAPSPHVTLADNSNNQPSWMNTPAAAASPNVFQNIRVLGTELKPRPCVMVAVTLPKGHRANQYKTDKERKAFWSAYGHGTLPADALVCLVTSGATSEAAAGLDGAIEADDVPHRASKHQLVFATVVRRDVEQLAWEGGPVVGLAFAPGADVERILRQMGTGAMPGTVLVQVRNS
jgi:hypothetical protein